MADMADIRPHADGNRQHLCAVFRWWFESWPLYTKFRSPSKLSLPTLPLFAISCERCASSLRKVGYKVTGYIQLAGSLVLKYFVITLSVLRTRSWS